MKFNLPSTWKESFTKYPNGFSVMEMLSSWSTKANGLAVEVDKKTDKTGDHAGTWQGLKPSQANESISSLVDRIDEDLTDHTDQTIKHRNLYYDNAPDPDLYEEEDIVIREGFSGIHSQGYVPTSKDDTLTARGGWWVRYEDGTQMCWTDINHEEPQDVETGALFRTNNPTRWIFPVEFLTGSGRAFFESASTFRWPQKTSPASGTHADYHILRTTSSTFEGTIHGFAIGRWK